MSRAGSARAAPAIAVAAALALPAAASAHGLVGKQDLPIPRWLFAWAAAVVLVVSFVGLAVLWADAAAAGASSSGGACGVPRVAGGPLSALIGVALFVFVVYAGLRRHAGRRRPTSLPTIVYVFFWVGIPFAQRAVRRRLPRVQPVAGGRQGRRLGRAAHAARRSGAEPLPYPAWLGRWPAVIGILVFAWVELVYANKDDPSQLATMALAYAAVQLVGMSLYGVERVVAARRRVRRLLRAVRADLAAALARPRAVHAPAAGRRAAADAGRRAPSRCCAR